MAMFILELLLTPFASPHPDDPRWMRIVGAVLWWVILMLFIGFIAFWALR